MKTFAMHTLGCKVNSYESNAIVRMFEAHDYVLVDFKEKADVYIINTCTVTNSGDSKSRKSIRQAIRRNSEAIICVIGCYAQVSPDEIIEIEGVDIVLGTQYRNQLIDLVENHDKNKQLSKVDNIFENKQFENMEIETYTDHKRAFLKIQEGCNKFCSYCIIPFARGLMRSRPLNSILEEANRLVDNGFNEIILTGIHTAGYGEDLEDYCFDDLLEDIIKHVPRLKRLRISSIEVSQITDRTLKLFKESDMIVKHFHIPLQAGSDEILSLMKRTYDTKYYLEKINEIRKEIPDVAITTDLIVGFPNETDELFEKSYEFAKQCAFSEIHVFPYSARKNTPAASMDNQIDPQVKDERVNRMLELSTTMNTEYTKRFINRELEVVVEDYNEETNMSVGHSKNYIKVVFEGKYELGSILNVKLIEVNCNNIAQVI